MDRKELIEKARELLACGALSKDAADAIKRDFPELSESEDERIINELIEAFEAYDIESSWNGFPVKSILAWLEKQKTTNEEGDFARGYDCGYECCLHSHGAEWFEKQKEQKPQDQSVDVIKMSALLAADRLASAEMTGRLKERKEILGNPEKYGLQKPVDIELIQRSWYMEGYHDREFGKEPKWIIKTGEGGPKHELNPKYGEYIKKEQKPNIEICPHSTKSKSYKESFYPIEDCDYGLEIAFDILEKTFGEVRGYQTDDGIREHQTAIEAVRKAKEQKPVLIAENDNWYICIKDFYAGGKKWASVGDLVQAKNGMYMMGRDDISEWFRRAYFEEVRDAFEPNVDTNIPEQNPVEKQDYSDLNDLERAILRGFLCAGVENVPVEIIKETAAECVGFLALIEPEHYWKPSEEQMEALNYAIAEWDGGKRLEGLYALRNDLKKLM